MPALSTSPLSGADGFEDYTGDPKGLGAAYRDIIGKHYPAMATVEVTRLVEPKALVEIEATAVIP